MIPAQSVRLSDSSPAPTRKWQRRLLQAVFTVWALVLFTIATILTARHAYVLPSPDAADLALASALRDLTDGQPHWSAFHVLYARCACSRKILTHLAESRRPSDIREHILLVGSARDGDAFRTQLAGTAFDVHLTTASELRQRFHVQSAPLLLVTDAHYAVRYAGGYSERKQGPVFSDVETMLELRAAATPRTLPIFGCAVSRDRGPFDPLTLAAALGI